MDIKTALLIEELSRQIETSGNFDEYQKLVSFHKTTPFTATLLLPVGRSNSIDLVAYACQNNMLETVKAARRSLKEDDWAKLIDRQCGSYSVDIINASCINQNVEMLEVIKLKDQEQWIKVLKWAQNGLKHVVLRKDLEFLKVFCKGIPGKDWIEMVTDLNESYGIFFTLTQEFTSIEDYNKTFELISFIKSGFHDLQLDEKNRYISPSWSRIVASTQKSRTNTGYIMQKSVFDNVLPDQRNLLLQVFIEHANSSSITKALCNAETTVPIVVPCRLSAQAINLFRSHIDDSDWIKILQKNSKDYETNVLHLLLEDFNLDRITQVLQGISKETLVSLLYKKTLGSQATPLELAKVDAITYMRQLFTQKEWQDIITFSGKHPSVLVNIVNKLNSGSSHYRRSVGAKITELLLNFDIGVERDPKNQIANDFIDSFRSNIFNTLGVEFFTLDRDLQRLLMKAYFNGMFVYDQHMMKVAETDAFFQIYSEIETHDLTNQDPAKLRFHLPAYTEEEIEDSTDAVMEFSQRLFLPLAALKVQNMMSLNSRDTIEQLSDLCVKAVAQFLLMPSDTKQYGLPLSPHELMQFSQQWHRPQSEMPRSITNLIKIREWHSFVDGKTFQYTVGNKNFLLEVLTTSRELEIEGRYLHHCVGRGSYAEKCVRGQSHILSIREWDAVQQTWLPSSTVEFDAVYPNKPLKILQHRAAHDAKPSVQNNAVLSHFTEDISTCKIRLSRTTGGIHTETPEEKGAEQYKLIGFIPSREKVLQVFHHYTHLLWQTGQKEQGSSKILRSIFLPLGKTKKVTNGGAFQYKSEFKLSPYQRYSGNVSEVVIHFGDYIDSILDSYIEEYLPSPLSYNLPSTKQLLLD